MSLVRIWGPDAPKQAFAEPPAVPTASRWDASSRSTLSGIQSPAAEQPSLPAGLRYSNAWSKTADRQPGPTDLPLPPGLSRAKPAVQDTLETWRTQEFQRKTPGGPSGSTSAGFQSGARLLQTAREDFREKQVNWDQQTVPGGSGETGESFVSDVNRMPPVQRPAPAHFSDPRGAAREQADLPEDPSAGYATAGDGRSRTLPHATGTPSADVAPYPVAGHRYPATGEMDYGRSGDIGNRPGDNSRLAFSKPNATTYPEAGANNRASSASYSAPERTRLFEPPESPLPPRDEKLPRNEPLPPRDNNPPRNGPLPRVPAVAASDPKPDSGLCETAQILARVGSDIVLAGEVLPIVDNAMEANKDKIPESQWEDTRKALIQQAIESRVQYKLICADVKRSLPPEGLEHVKGLFEERFEDHEIPDRVKKANLPSRLELEHELKKIGSSLAQEKRLYVERSMAMKWVDENVRNTEEITHDDMLDYYREHQKDYEHPGRARWEQLTVRFSGHPNKGEAFAALARMGNEVLDGRLFGDVAKEYSEGTTARDGGARDWTTQGSLRSKELDRAIFALPVGKLSQVIEDEESLHIIRVTEREAQSQTPFVEAQVEIKEKINLTRRQKQFEKFTERLKSEIPVWTVFDDQTTDNRSAQSGKSPIR